MKCLGIDIGSSTIKGAGLDVERGELGPVLSRPFPGPVRGLPAGRFEVEPEPVLESVGRLIEELLDRSPDARRIFFTGQMGGVILLDATGRPVSNYCSWRDQRASERIAGRPSLLEEAKSILGPARLRELGNELKPGSVTSLLFALAREGRLPEAATPATLAGFVVGSLCRARPVEDPTEAIGALNLPTSTFHHEAFECLGLSGLNWPRLATYREHVGSARFGSRELICHAPTGDHQCSLLGVGLEDRELSINISTGSQVSLLTHAPTLGDWQTRSAFDGRYLNTITHLPAGRSLNVLMELLTELAGPTAVDPWATALAKAEEAEDSELEVSLTFFDGPMGDRGRIEGITVDNLGVGAVIRASLRSMADCYELCARRLATPTDYDRVVLSGGFSKKARLLRRMIEERFPRPLRECPEGEDSLNGLIELARRSLGG